jgi:hypothetical protein
MKPTPFNQPATTSPELTYNHQRLPGFTALDKTTPADCTIIGQQTSLFFPAPSRTKTGH